MKAKRFNWSNGDIFLIPLLNNNYVVGQVLDLAMKNVVRCAIYDEAIKSEINIKKLGNIKNLISLITCTREQLDFGAWKIIGNKEITIPKSIYPFEDTRVNGWIGLKTYDAAIVEDFVNSYYSLLPWDDMANPNYYDELLINKEKKPKNLLLKKNTK
jgi:immunity protein 26 of polymorphic toxin system